ncbi:Fungal specific transcription factor, putative [Coccidioides posadasii C735 delta SOWgp]|uniref:Fungal specific transcription factor, putative n=1 Tax=Coccidioides posadasii (strain C735) TaxID=222929 RepID=C5NZG8_COCP7|nr:Fungal specific transcription factor, putative [Coccidioides posadasii C735 delta SOWgp]EER29861.1 Fungal specific transcription factor, putative [Coccidioides posadasii C735 delta SOWgp]|eukprot:XP_003072006.1 Fungal specific transcription factor, putative [Coccidioides posadasii C735 delta SOWgp]
MSVVRPRVKVACKLCHSRRVKCDRTEESACTNCQLAGQECQSIISRRGKYKRHRNEPGRVRSVRGLKNGGPLPDPSPKGDSTVNSHAGLPAITQEACETVAAPRETCEEAPPPPVDSSSNTQGNDNEMVHYGDSFNLNYIFREMCDPFDTASGVCSPEKNSENLKNLESLYLENLDGLTRLALDERKRDDNLRLRSHGAFRMPPKEVGDELIRVFFRYSLPMSSLLFDREDFCLKYESGRISPLLLHAIHFVAIIHCEDSVYKAAGFQNRHEASCAFYHRAKALYDANYESDSIVNLQTVCLLSQWWGTPTEQKYTWHWMGIAASLAQSLELHRSRAYANLNTKHRKLRRRMWWGIYILDILESLILGQTPHVNDAYCDVSQLTEDDFDDEDEEIIESHMLGKRTTESTLFLIYLSDLTTKISRCLLMTFGANADESTRTESLETLSSWETSLPKELHYPTSTISIQNGFWASLLHLLYYTCRILLHRNGSHFPDRMAVGTTTFDAAVKVVRMLEDLLSSDALCFSPLYVIAPTFASLSTHIANMQSSSQKVRDVSEHRVHLCMLVLDKLQDYWPPVAWNYRLFSRILQALKARQSVDKCPPYQDFSANAGFRTPQPGSSSSRHNQNSLGESFVCGLASEFPMVDATVEPVDIATTAFSFGGLLMNPQFNAEIPFLYQENAYNPGL